MSNQANHQNSCHQSIMPTSSGCLTGDLCPKNMFFGNLEVDRLNVQALLAVTITVIIGMISTLLIFKSNSSFPDNIYADTATLIRV